MADVFDRLSDDDLAGIKFPDADTERAIRAGRALPGTLEDDIARWPADRVFEESHDA